MPQKSGRKDKNDGQRIAVFLDSTYLDFKRVTYYFLCQLQRFTIENNKSKNLLKLPLNHSAELSID